MKKCPAILSLILLIAFLSACAVQPVRYEGKSMMPALNDGDKLLIDKNLSVLKRGDVITFLYPKDRTKWFVKRIIGLPGETVEIRQGKTYINGQILDEPYVDDAYNQSKPTFPPRLVPEYQYFVVGDNRDNSSDSRYWGSLDEKLITGKYYATYSKAGE